MLRRSTKSSGITVKIVEFYANVINNRLSNIINNDICQNRYSKNGKSSPLRRMFKKDDQTIKIL